MVPSLKSHSAAPPRFVRDVTAHALRESDGSVSFRYGVTGDTRYISLPQGPRGARNSESARADDLWQDTCFEAFIALGGEAYVELNFSPSGQWAAYHFDGRRRGMRNLEPIKAPRIRGKAGDGHYDLRANVDLGGVAGLKPDATWRVGLTAIILESAYPTYWALAHGPGKPDFHDPATFTFDLPPPEPR